MRIYLAGPFFNEKQLETIQLIEKEFDKHGIDYFSPRKGGGSIAHLPLEEKKKESKRIYDSNVEEMVKANILFAVVDGRDTGTVYEMGYFKCLTVATPKPRYSITYTNENFGLNIMLKESVDAHVVGQEELEKFSALISSNWDDPVPAREKILSQFQNFNPDVI